MQNNQRPISEIVSEIQDFLDKLDMTQEKISHATGLNQATISRLMRRPADPRRNISSGIKKICIYADIPIYYPEEKNLEKQQELLDTLESVWNGTDAHAAALTKLLKAISRAAKC